MDREFSPKLLRDILEQKGKDAQWLSRETGATPTTVSQWLAGVSRPRGSSLRLIALVLKVRESQLTVPARRKSA